MICNRRYPAGYRLPEKNVLLVSCMDLRPTDDLVRLTDYDNLANRYDHFTLAGGSLGSTLLEQGQCGPAVTGRLFCFGTGKSPVLQDFYGWLIILNKTWRLHG